MRLVLEEEAAVVAALEELDGDLLARELIFTEENGTRKKDEKGWEEGERKGKENQRGNQRKRRNWRPIGDRRAKLVDGKFSKDGVQKKM